MNTLSIDVEGVERGDNLSHPFLPISCLSITAIAVNWNVLTRRLGWLTHKDALTSDFKSIKKNPLGIASERRMLAFTDANHNFKGTSKPSSIQMYAL